MPTRSGWKAFRDDQRQIEAPDLREMCKSRSFFLNLPDTILSRLCDITKL